MPRLTAEGKQIWEGVKRGSDKRNVTESIRFAKIGYKEEEKRQEKERNT